MPEPNFEEPNFEDESKNGPEVPKEDDAFELKEKDIVEETEGEFDYEKEKREIESRYQRRLAKVREVEKQIEEEFAVELKRFPEKVGYGKPAGMEELLLALEEKRKEIEEEKSKSEDDINKKKKEEQENLRKKLIGEYTKKIEGI